MRVTSERVNGIVPALTSIRFLAALTVVLSHYRELELLAVPAWFFSFVDGGRSAVSLFFVLSGFILTFTYRDAMATDGPRNFYVARVARIYPVVLFALGVGSIVTTWLLVTHNDTLLLKWYSLKSMVYLGLAVSFICQTLLITAWFPFAAVNQPWNGPASSVSCEAFFYAMFPLLLRRFVAMRPATLAFTMLGCWLAQGALIVMLQYALPVARNHFLIGALPLTRIAEFAIGMGAALAYQGLRARGGPTHISGVALVSASLVVLCAIACWQPVSPVFYLQGPFFAALILGLALLERPVLGLLNQRWLVRLGEASYSLFLIHVPLAYLAILTGFRSPNGWIPLVFTLLFSVAMFTYFEEPMRRLIRARFRSPSTAPVATVEPVATPADAAVTIGPGMRAG